MYQIVTTLLLCYNILKAQVISIIRMKARTKNHYITLKNFPGAAHVPNREPPASPVFLNAAVNADTLLNPLAGVAIDIKEIIGTNLHELNPREGVFLLSMTDKIQSSNGAQGP